MQERLYKRGEVWWARIAGKRVSTKCTDRRAAEAWYRNQERRIQGAGGTASDAPPHSIQDAVIYFVEKGCFELAAGTVRMYAEKGGHLLRLLGGRDVNAMRRDDVADYIAQRLEEGAAKSTVHKELIALRRALKLAVERELLLRDPAVMIPKFKGDSQPRERFLTSSEFSALLVALRIPQWRLWTAIAVYTGGRRSEVGSLKWEHVDLEAGLIHLHRTKRKKVTRLPIHPALLEILRAVRPLTGSGLVVGDWPNAVRDLALACRRAGIVRATPNDLRRTMASWLKQDGVDSSAVAQLMGHSSTKMVDQVYGKLDAATLARAIGHLPGSTSGHCAAGVPDAVASGGLGGLPGIDNPLKLVLEDRVELSTRGFSVRRSVERKPNISKLKEE